jgi:hypothetical protein
MASTRPTADEYNTAEALALAEIIRRLEDPINIADMSMGELSQTMFALKSSRESPELMRLKRQAEALKKRFGDGKTGKKKAHRWQTGSRKPQARRQEQDPEARSDA